MKRRLAADEVKRRAIRARLSGIASRDIAQRLGRRHDTIKGHLSSCGATVEGSYHLNGAFASGSSQNKTYWRWAPPGTAAVGLAVFIRVRDVPGATGDV